MLTSLGSHFSNDAFSGAFTDVWAETIAPSFVAAGMLVGRLVTVGELTWAVLSDDVIDELCLDGIHNEVCGP